jgi:hypothetical protein
LAALAQESIGNFSRIGKNGVSGAGCRGIGRKVGNTSRHDVISFEDADACQVNQFAGGWAFRDLFSQLY